MIKNNDNIDNNNNICAYRTSSLQMRAAPKEQDPKECSWGTYRLGQDRKDPSGHPSVWGPQNGGPQSRST